MGRDILVLRSMTYAYKAQKILERSWIPSSVIRTPEAYSDRGCSYSLVVRGDPDRAAEILRQNGMQVLRVVHQS